jgi:hypothetical protein
MSLSDKSSRCAELLDIDAPVYGRTTPSEKVMHYFIPHIDKADFFQISASKEANEWDCVVKLISNGKESVTFVKIDPTVKEEQMVISIKSEIPTIMFFNRATILTGILTVLGVASTIGSYITYPLGISLSAGLASIWLAFLIQRIRLTRK